MVLEALANGCARLATTSNQPRRDAELLLMHALGRDRAYLLTHPEAELSAAQSSKFSSYLARRVSHEPVQYIRGEQEFFGLGFEVNRDVLIPRPETEHLVEALLVRAPRSEAFSIADVGTGSGAIAVALAHSLPLAQVTAIDMSPEALQIAGRNAGRHGVAGRVRLLEGDLLAGMPDAVFDFIVSNPPYIRTGEALERQVAEWEPHAALFAGPTGLEIYERLVPQAYAALRPGGWLLLEIGHGQQPALARLLDGWQDAGFERDLRGIPRVACARRSA